MKPMNEKVGIGLLLRSTLDRRTPDPAGFMSWYRAPGGYDFWKRESVAWAKGLPMSSKAKRIMRRMRALNGKFKPAPYVNAWTDYAGLKP